MYVVKLFWMGDWRKIEIDNHVPIEKINATGIAASTAKAAAKCTLSRLVSSLMIDDEVTTTTSSFSSPTPLHPSTLQPSHPSPPRLYS